MSFGSLDDCLVNVLSESYAQLEYNCRAMYFPWFSKSAFIDEWVQAYKADNSISDMRLSVCLAGCPELSDKVFDTILSFARLPKYPHYIYNRVQEIRSYITLGLSGLSTSLMISGSSMSSEGRDLGSSTRSNGRLPPEHAEDPMWQQMLDLSASGIPGQEIDNEPSTTIASQSSEQQAGVTVVDPRDFEFPNSDIPTPPETDFMQCSPLLLLTRISKSKKKASHPKKEYFRCQHIRALKKSIRQLKDEKLPGTSIHKVNRSNPSHIAKWNQLKEFYRANKQYLNSISGTAAGPITDGKKKREADESNAAKSYNHEYCRTFFGNNIVKRYNELFSALVYDCPPEEMCRKMKAQCCSSSLHSSDCVSVWREVHEYARRGMLQEIGLDVDVEMGDEELRPDDFLSNPSR